MRRAARIVLWLLSALAVVPILAAGAVLLALNTDPGRRLAERQLSSLTGGTVVLQGLSGRFPDGLRARNLELRDSQGVWLLADEVLLDWLPFTLLQRAADLTRIEAARVQVLRRPVTAPAPAAPADTGPFTLPVRVQVRRLHVARVELGPDILGAPAALSVDGSADLVSLEAGRASLDVRRLDSDGRYALVAETGRDEVNATLDVSEPEGGLIARIAALPDIGPLKAAATLRGPRRQAILGLQLSAGPLRAEAAGMLNLVERAADLTVSGNAPAMAPAPEVSWQAVDLKVRVHGPLTAPDAAGQLRIEKLRAGGASVGLLTADIEGNAGRVGLRAQAFELRVPGPNAALLGTAPAVLDASLRLDDPALPATFSLSHPLISVTGRAQIGGGPRLSAELRLPDLAPLAALGGFSVQGELRLDLQAAPSALEADGALSITGGTAPLPGLIGRDAKLGFAAKLNGQDLTLTRFDLAGQTLSISASGSRKGGEMDATARIALADLAVPAPGLSGAAQIDARLRGPLDRLSLGAEVTGTAGAPSVPSGPVALKLDLQGLPAAPAGTVTAQGEFAGAPVTLALTASRAADGALHATIDRAAWRSLVAEGALDLPPGATLPQGRISLRMPRLDDLRVLTGQSLSGGISATLDLDPAETRLHLTAAGAGVPGSRVGRAEITARVSNLATQPAIIAAMALDGIDAGGTTGSAKVDLSGTQQALGVRATAALRLAGIDTQLQGAAVVDGAAQRAVVNSFHAVARNETLRLVAPATISFGNGIAVDRLRLGLRQASLDVAGQLSPRLNATAALRAPADLLAALAPDLAPELVLDGTLSADAQLTGTPAQPGGVIRLQATGLRMRSGAGRGLPPANLTASAQLAGTSARIDGKLSAGAAQLSVSGQVPLGAGPLSLRGTGGFELALLDPILTAAGRRARGRLVLDAVIGGTMAAPRVSGTAQLTGGEVQDFAQGFRVTGLAASVSATGDTIRLTSLTGRAGPGSVAASGSLGLGEGLPLDLTLTLRNARPLESDRLTADLDADVTLRGPLDAGLQAGGRVLIRRAEIRIPETLPASIAVLDVRRPGQKPPAPATAAPIRLDLSIDAPGAVFVRGRGVDAELSGALRLRGTSASPQVSGGLDLRRGQISLAGTTLTFTRGKVGFDGTGLSRRIDPTLDFAADSTAGGVTATLGITGYASAPKIKLSSVPDLPQDEVLAYLLFKRSAKELGPFQIAQIAASLASLTGAGGGLGDPLDNVRRGLGLDRLSLGAGAKSNSAPTVEAGRYVANGVYVGAKQGTAGGQTGATVQIDITKGLKLQTDVGTGQGGNQVGLTYQFEY